MMRMFMSGNSRVDTGLQNPKSEMTKKELNIFLEDYEYSDADEDYIWMKSVRYRDHSEID